MSYPTLSLPWQHIAEEIHAELAHARSKHGKMNSPHEGYATILEEVDELWDHVKDDTGYTIGARHEALQIAAMAIRYIEDLKLK